MSGEHCLVKCTFCEDKYNKQNQQTHSEGVGGCDKPRCIYAMNASNNEREIKEISGPDHRKK